MDRIRILLVAMPRLTRDIVEAGLRAEPDMVVVGVLDSTASLLEEARRVEPDVVVTGADRRDVLEECPSLFGKPSATRVLTIEPGAGDAHLFELRPHQIDLGEVSPTDIVRAIRSTARNRSWQGGVP